MQLYGIASTIVNTRRDGGARVWADLTHEDPKRSEQLEYLLSMGKRKGRQRDTAFTIFGDAEFREKFYDRRKTLEPPLRERVEREAKARGIRNIRKRNRN
jgi:hypothetical protein